MRPNRTRGRWAGFAGAALLAVASSAAGEALLTEQGIELSMGDAGELYMQYPVLHDAGGKPLGKIAKKTITENGGRAAIAYDNGAVVHFERKAAGLLHMRFENPPAGFARYRLAITLPLAPFAGVGTFQVGDAAPVPFPGQKPEKWMLFQGDNARNWVFTPVEGGTPVRLVDLPAGSFGQVQDNREWRTNNFFWFVSCPRYADHPFVPLDFGADKDAPVTALAARPTTVIDRFGQDFVKDFAAKVKDEAELKADVAAEADYYARFQAPERDRWGGLPGSGEELGLKKTGFFHVERKGDRWHLVNPDGNLFYHLGLCCFAPLDDYTYTRERPDGFFEWLPKPDDPTFHTAWRLQDNWWKDKAFSFYVANTIRKYGAPYDADAWQRRMIDRVRPMGFTSVGAFSGHSPVWKEKNFPYTTFVGGGGPDLPGARGFWDPFEPEAAKTLDTRYADGVAKNADNPLIIGYYLANEQGAEDLPRALPALPGKHAVKRWFVEQLKTKYKDIAVFNDAWDRADESFDALLDSPLRAGTRDAHADVTALVAEFLERYYRLIHDTFKKYDKNHMLIGSRWQPGTANNEILVKACAKYNDVISLNYYTVGFDKAYVDRLYRWAGEKPFFFSEWHYTSALTSGLPGSHGLQTQQDRADAYRHYVEQSASWGYVVGSEWFTLVDQARGGRWFSMLNGERANTGFFAVTDRPWKELCEGAYETHKRIYDVFLGKTEPYVFDDPRFVAKGAAQRTVNAHRVAAPLEIDGSANGWPGVPPEMVTAKQTVSGPANDAFSAAFRVAWDDEHLYFHADVNDETPRENPNQDGRLWAGDAIELFTGVEELDQPGGMRFGDRQLLLGAGRGDGQVFMHNAAAGRHAAPRVVVADKPDGKGYFVEAAIPFAALGLEKPEADRLLLFDVGVDDSEGAGRIRQLMWNGTAKASGDRTVWGRLRLAE